MLEVIDEDFAGNLNNLSRSEVLFAEGERGEARIYFDGELPDEIVLKIEQALLEQGVVLTKPVRQANGTLYISFEKAIAPLMIIAGFVGVIAAGYILFIGWQVLKELRKVIEALPAIAWWLGGAVGALLLWRSIKAKPAKFMAPGGYLAKTYR